MGKVLNPDAMAKVFIEKGYTLDEWLDALRLTASEARTAIIELIDDHASFKTSVDGGKTAIDELIDDHASFKTSVDGSKTAIDELIDDHATFKTVVDDIKALANALKASFTAGLMSAPGLVIGSTKPNVANVLFYYMINGTIYACAAVAAGTAPGNDVIPQSKYGAVAFEIGTNGTIDAVEATANATGYDSSALALAGLPGVQSNHVRMGTVTATKSDGAFTFATTNLDAVNSTVAYADGSVGIAVGGSTVTTSAPATLTASKPTAGPATLTATKPTAGPATLTAGDPTAVPFEFGA